MWIISLALACPYPTNKQCCASEHGSQLVWLVLCFSFLLPFNLKRAGLKLNQRAVYQLSLIQAVSRCKSVQKRERIEKKSKAKRVDSGVSSALFVLVERHLEPGRAENNCIA